MTPCLIRALDCAPSVLSVVSETCAKLPNTLYLISGSFNVIFLYTLAFNIQTRQLNVTGRTGVFGPHSYLAKNAPIDRLYTTSFAQPPTLVSWYINWREWDAYGRYPTLEHLDTVNTTSTPAYIALTSSYIYSVGGPTGAVHKIDPANGGFGQQIQQLLYVDADQLPFVDKTRSGIRNGTHSIELTTTGFAFAANLGRNSIWMYKLDRSSGKLVFLSENKSFREGDAPRHVLPSPNEKYLYCATENTSFVDVYEIMNDHLEHRQSASILPPGLDRGNYRGDTVRLSRKHLHLRPHTPRENKHEGHGPLTYLFATTRGTTTEYKGYIAAFAISSDGLIVNPSDQTPHSSLPLHSLDPSKEKMTRNENIIFPASTFQTPTSGGQANAIELAPYEISSCATPGGIADAEWMVLTDGEQGLILIVEWSGKRGSFKIISDVLLDAGVGGNSSAKALPSVALWLA